MQEGFHLPQQQRTTEPKYLVCTKYNDTAARYCRSVYLRRGRLFSRCFSHGKTN